MSDILALILTTLSSRCTIAKDTSEKEKPEVPAMTTNAKFVPDKRIEWPPGHSPVTARVFAQNTIEINATPETVWSLLIDCKAWPCWYKHCSDVSILEGGPLLGPGSEFRFKTIGNYFEPKVDTFEPSRMLVWSAVGPLGTSGAHAWYIEPTSSGCAVITEESQHGLLLLLLGGRIRGTLLDAHQEWLRALKQLAEDKERA